MAQFILTLLVLLNGLTAARPQSAPANGRFDSPAERELVQLVNQERAKAGLPALAVDDRLTRAAREHSVLLAQHGELSHQFGGEPIVSRRLAATGIRFNTDGENVALDSGTAANVHDGLMHSPPHRANILSEKYNAIGIGAVRKGDVIYVTEDFARRLDELPAKEAEDLVAGSVIAARKNAAMSPFQRKEMLFLRSLACSMAEKGALDTAAALKIAGTKSAISFTEGEPQNLPANVVKTAADPAMREFAVGACFGGRSDKYPSGTWWVVMIFS